MNNNGYHFLTFSKLYMVISDTEVILTASYILYTQAGQWVKWAAVNRSICTQYALIRAAAYRCASLGILSPVNSGKVAAKHSDHSRHFSSQHDIIMW